ncbi:MAG: adenosylcobinamide-GDP ribazoletransferase [Cryptosporangiaceae bacterium]|nr:adenosylcobinamide-GDP ribazoletransferase [Cryptosporangiaceae bacterium]
MGDLRDGLRLALTLLTVAPVRSGRVDRATATVAMAAAPAVGLLIGALSGAVLVALTRIGMPALPSAVAAVALAAGLTRGLHLDGLADTVDGLGSYGGPERALAVMKQPDIGPFGVVAIVLALLGQTAALAAIAYRPAPQVILAVAVALGTGRLAAALACRRGVPAARPEGMGALVAGVVRPVTVAAWAIGLGLAGAGAGSWPGAAAVALGLGAAALLVRHTVRRFGGITGDVIGAAIELTSTICLVVLTIPE